jgi:hypothetical protein
LVKAPHLLDTISSRIPSGDDRRVRLTRVHDHVSSVEPFAAAMRALAEPLNYPPMSVSTVPGDRVAIAVDSAVPSARQVVRGTVQALTDAGVDPESISVVVASAELAELFRAEPIGNETGGVQIVLHDPDDEANLCFVGVNKRKKRTFRGKPRHLRRRRGAADRPGASARRSVRLLVSTVFQCSCH